MQQVPLIMSPNEYYHARTCLTWCSKETTTMNQYGTLHLPPPQCIQFAEPHPNYSSNPSLCQVHFITRTYSLSLIPLNLPKTSGITSTRAVVKHLFMSSKHSSHFSVQENGLSFLMSCVNGFTFFENPSTNLL